jgi:hypothetical protein
VGINNFKNPEYVFCDVLRLTDTSVECLVGGLIHYYCKDSFLKGWEELPDSNLQKLEEVKVNQTPNPVDLEKKEVNKVERALGELKDALTKQDNNESHSYLYAVISTAAQNLVIALETEKEVTQEDWEKYHANHKYKSEYQEDIMSKPEPKIDMKEERVEPVSIWKNVSELPEGLVDEGIVEWKRGGYSLGMTAHGRFLASAGNVVSSGESVAKFTSLADFINSFEQMQKDIEELKRK